MLGPLGAVFPPLPVLRALLEGGQHEVVRTPQSCITLNRSDGKNVLSSLLSDLKDSAGRAWGRRYRTQSQLTSLGKYGTIKHFHVHATALFDTPTSQSSQSVSVMAKNGDPIHQCTTGRILIIPKNAQTNHQGSLTTRGASPRLPWLSPFNGLASSFQDEETEREPQGGGVQHLWW